MAERSDPAAVAEMDARIAAIGGWRGKVLARLRALIRDALPDMVETIKWKKPTNPAGVPAFERAGGGILCIADAFKDKVKVTFGRGAMLPDPDGLFNASLGGAAMRAIDLHEGATLDAAAFQALIRAAADEWAQRAGRAQRAGG